MTMITHGGHNMSLIPIGVALTDLELNKCTAITAVKAFSRV
jgi:hypothetical protein